jgi:hypothetical protein
MLASCCAIGRSSVEATKACLILAVRARLAARLALPARLAGLRLLAETFLLLLAVGWTSLAAKSSALLAFLDRLWLLAAGLFAGVLARLDFLPVTVLPFTASVLSCAAAASSLVAEVLPLAAVLLLLAAAVLLLVAEAWGCVAAGSPEDCPTTGGTAIRIESRRAMERPRSGSGEDRALISPLYAVSRQPSRPRTTRVTAGAPHSEPCRPLRSTIGNFRFGSLPCCPLHSSFTVIVCRPSLSAAGLPLGFSQRFCNQPP